MEDNEIDILRAQNKALRERVEALEEQLETVRAFLRDAENVGYCEYEPSEEEEDAGPSRAEVDAALMRMPYHRAKALLAKYHVTSLDMLSDIFLLDVLNEARASS